MVVFRPRGLAAGRTETSVWGRQVPVSGGGGFSPGSERRVRREDMEDDHFRGKSTGFQEPVEHPGKLVSELKSFCSRSEM